MSTLNIMLGLIIVACLLLGVGFQFRRYPWGLAIMWLGALTMLAVFAYKIYDVTTITP